MLILPTPPTGSDHTYFCPFGNDYYAPISYDASSSFICLMIIAKRCTSPYYTFLVDDSSPYPGIWFYNNIVKDNRFLYHSFSLDNHTWRQYGVSHSPAADDTAITYCTLLCISSNN